MRVCASSLTCALFASSSLARLLTPTPALSDPTITPAPEVPIELFRKQNDNRFMGWISLDGTWTARSCNIGYTYYQAGSVWRCCSTAFAGCNVPVGCVAGSLIFRVSTSGMQTSTFSTVACTSGLTNPADLSLSVCNTGLLYESAEAAGTDARTNIFCGANSLIYSYYRVKPFTSTSSSTSSSSTPQSTSVTTTTPSPSSSSSSPSPIPTSPPLPPPEPKSQAWIAGAVVGPVAGLALIGATLFLLLRRRKKPFSSSPPPTTDTPQKPTLLPVGVGTHTPSSSSPQSPYQQQQQQQQPWQHLPPQQGQQTYPAPPPPSSTSSPPPPQPSFNNAHAYRQPGVEDRPFSAELDGSV